MKIFLKNQFVIFTTLVVGVLLLSACKKEPKLSVTPSILTFKAHETEEKALTIDTDAKSWTHNVSYKSESDWITVNKKRDNENQLIVKVNENFNTASSRTGTITISAGKAATVDVTVEQEKSPYPGKSTYSATGAPLFNITGHMFTSWTGELIPNTTTSTPTYYTLTNWANKSVEIRIHYVGGQFQTNRTFRQLYDPSGYGGYLHWGTIDFNAQELTYYLNENRTIPYNATTRTFELGTHNGLPVFLAILVINERTGQWVTNGYFVNAYYDLKIVHSATTYASQIKSSEAENSIVKYMTPNDFKIIFVDK